MGRMIVQPESAPQWIGGHGYGRHFGRKNYNSKTPDEIYDKKKEKDVEKEIEKILDEKFKNSEQYTKQQKAQIKNTIKVGIKLSTHEILSQAIDEVNRDLDIENGNFDSLKQMYYAELSERARKIAIQEYDLSESFDIKEAIRREKEIDEKLRAGDITIEQAKKMLGKPILFESRNTKFLNLRMNRESDEEMER